MWSAGGESDPDVSATEWTQRRNALRALLVATVPGAAAAAEDLRRTLKANRFEYRGHGIGMTLSAGVVELGPDGNDWDELYRVADARLYECKAQGRNCVVSAAGTRDGRGNVHGHVRRPESVDGG